MLLTIHDWIQSRRTESRSGFGIRDSVKTGFGFNRDNLLDNRSGLRTYI